MIGMEKDNYSQACGSSAAVGFITASLPLQLAFCCRLMMVETTYNAVATAALEYHGSSKHMNGGSPHCRQVLLHGTPHNVHWVSLNRDERGENFRLRFFKSLLDLLIQNE